MRLLAILFVMLCVPPVFAETPLRVAVDAPYPPFAYQDESTGKLTGFDVDMAEALCHQIKRPCIVEVVPFDEIIPAIAGGKIDMAVAGIVNTPERARSVIFTKKYFRTNTIFIGRIGNRIEEPFVNKSIAVQSGTNLEEYILANYRDKNRILSQKSAEDIYMAVKNGKADLGFVDGLSAFGYLRSEEGEQLEMIGEPVTVDDGSCIALHPSLTELRDALDKAILALRANGEYQKINRKYFPINVY